MSYVTGGHAAKIGVTLTAGTESGFKTNDDVGNMSFATFRGQPLQVIHRAYPVSQTNYLRPNLGIYAQDQWTLNHVTVNAGLRFDYFRSGYPDQSLPPVEFAPVQRDFPGTIAVTWKDLSPRLGVAYDLFGNARTVVKATANRYVARNGLGWSLGLNPVETNSVNFRFWSDTNGNFFPDGDPLNPAPNGELGPSFNRDFGQPVINTFYDDDWAFGWGKRPANWEFSASIQHEVIPRIAVKLGYFRRVSTNFSVADNRAVGPADYDPYCVTVPVDPRLPDGGGNDLCGLFDLTPSKVGLIDQITTSADTFGTQLRHWDGVDLTVNARLDNGVLLEGGLSTGKTTTDTCDFTPDSPQTLWCHTETPFLTQVKLLGAYLLPYGVQISAAFQSIPGPEIGATVFFGYIRVSQLANYANRAVS